LFWSRLVEPANSTAADRVEHAVNDEGVAGVGDGRIVARLAARASERRRH